MTDERWDPEFYRERWDPEQRFRLYVRLAGTAMSDRREVMAVETSAMIGPMIELARSEGEFGPRDRSAVLDTAPWEFGKPGEWIIGSLA